MSDGEQLQIEKLMNEGLNGARLFRERAFYIFNDGPDVVACCGYLPMRGDNFNKIFMDVYVTGLVVKESKLLLPMLVRLRQICRDNNWNRVGASLLDSTWTDRKMFARLPHYVEYAQWEEDAAASERQAKFVLFSFDEVCDVASEYNRNELVPELSELFRLLWSGADVCQKLEALSEMDAPMALINQEILNRLLCGNEGYNCPPILIKKNR